jgi:hypothetical protein
MNANPVHFFCSDGVADAVLAQPTVQEKRHLMAFRDGELRHSENCWCMEGRADCPHERKKRYGRAIYCQDCEIRLKLYTRQEIEQMVTEAMLRDYGI